LANNESAIVEETESETLDLTLGAPVEAEARPALASDKAITEDQKEAAKSIAQATRDKLDKEPKVKIRVPKEYGPQTVIINMARYEIPSGVFFDVPETVAQMLRDSGRI